MANHHLLSLSLTFLMVFHGCLAYQPFQQQQNECQIQRINPLEPNERVEAEGGRTEFFDANDKQFRCAGVEPSTSSALKVGKGYQGIMLPGCPETFQSSQQLQEQSQQSFQDRHQKIRNFRQGDVIVIPAGAAHWMYNDGQEDIVAVVLLDSTNQANQLDQFHRRFFLAGNPKQGQQQQQEEGSANIFRGFDLEILSQAFNVDPQTAQKLQSPGDNRGHIIRVERGLQVIKPPVPFQQQERGNANGFEETVCSTKLTANIDNPSHVDIYNPQAGRCTHLNSQKLPSSKWFNSAPREEFFTVLNAIVSPYWVMNAHSILQVTSGSMRMQIVNNKGESVFNEQIREGQLVVVPQNFAVVKQAGQEGCRWIAFRTNDNAMINTLAGHNSAIRAMPVDVIASAYQMPREQALNLKFNRKETEEEKAKEAAGFCGDGYQKPHPTPPLATFLYMC
ncbi:hypothetical protein OSB04_000931 [Centaurea solstitialis]|uniref:Cupin type-1 domain-containing protein n=1 Tax=Centaurea solstitialis TaxID=347529 RepID=A0AA38WSD8_9ASTR|nr:hypothetical protein OSB04_000931 [Centaurea solstitialis]